MSTTAATAAEDNRARVQRLIDEVYNQGNFSIADELFADNAVRYDPATPDIERGPAGSKQVASRYRQAFPDLQITIHDMVVDENKVAARWSSTGTHSGDLQGIAPTGKTFSITGISILRFADGKIVEEWANWDTLGMMKQLGLAPK
jgi:steroid delta-isomerase-like uncharacterized protein